MVVWWRTSGDAVSKEADDWPNRCRWGKKMNKVTHNFEITHSIPKAELVEALLKANGFFPYVLSPGVMCAEIQEKTSIEGRLHRTVKDTVKADREPFLYNHSTVERDEKGNISKEISHEVKIEALTLDRGSVCTYAGRYFNIGEVDITEEEIIKAMREKASVMFGAVQAYSAPKLEQFMGSLQF